MVNFPAFVDRYLARIYSRLEFIFLRLNELES